MIYLDHNATTPIDEEVVVAFVEALAFFGNPSSGHRIGRVARAAIDTARHQVALLLGAGPTEIIFTSGGTEANNLAILGTAYLRPGGHIISSVIEHPAVLHPLKWLEQHGWEVTQLPVDGFGRVDPADVERSIRKNTILVTVMHSNNETGVLQPVREISSITRSRGVPLHTDAAQSVGKMGVDVEQEMVDLLTVVSHKFYGPKGIGALYLRDGVVISPILFGAGHERGLRPGTENTPSIVAFGKACAIAQRDLPERYAHAMVTRELLCRLLAERLDVTLNGHASLRLPNTLNLSIKGIVAEDLVASLGEEVAFSSGSACHAGVRMPSTVLTAMGLSAEDALSSVRLSVGKDTTPDEIARAADLIAATAEKLR